MNEKVNNKTQLAVGLGLQLGCAGTVIYNCGMTPVSYIILGVTLLIMICVKILWR